MNEVIILGENYQTGAYLLHLTAAEDLRVRFGNFQKGCAILVPCGEYIYAGSAMAGKGSMILARRLLRHATRHDALRPQKIRQILHLACKEAGLGPKNLQVPAQKKLFWNIDYLLEEQAISLSQVIILRSPLNLEDELAQFLMSQPGSRILAKKLGAHDKPGQTHLLALTETVVWWQQLPEALSAFVGGFSK